MTKSAVMMIAAACAVLSLSGCLGDVKDGDNCRFWTGRPWHESQQPWRDFDCPLEGQQDVRDGAR